MRKLPPGGNVLAHVCVCPSTNRHTTAYFYRLNELQLYLKPSQVNHESNLHVGK